MWECECACEGSVLGLKCQLLDQVSYNQAGYQGAPPPGRRKICIPNTKTYDDGCIENDSDELNTFISLIILLLIMGNAIFIMTVLIRI